MSSTGIQLDFSKAQPITDQPGASSGSSGVQLDFTKSQPISTDQALSTAAATVAKPKDTADDTTLSDLKGTTTASKVRDTVDETLGNMAPAVAEPPHKDFQISIADGKLKYSYPAGQTQFSAQHPELSVDSDGNIYYQGNKTEGPDTTPVFMPGGGRVLLSAASSGGRAAVGAGLRYLGRGAARDPELQMMAGKAALANAGTWAAKKLLPFALGGASGGIVTKLLHLW